MKADLATTARFPDALRDAERYDLLVYELDEAWQTLRTSGALELDSADEALERLLPMLARALNGKLAFLVEATRSDLAPNPVLRVVSVYNAPPDLIRRSLPWSPLWKKLFGRALAVVEDNRKANSLPIPGLELFDARAVVLVRVEMGDRALVVGVCNRQEEHLGPFLAYDRKILESLVNFIMIGIELGERRKKELKGLLESALEVTAEQALDPILTRITDSAGTAFGAPVSVMLWNDDQSALVIKACWGLSPAYQQSQAVPRARAEEILRGMGAARTAVNQNLQRGAYGDRRLVLREGLSAVMYTRLMDENRLAGVLNIYARAANHQFSEREKELAGIFAMQITQALHNTSLVSQLRASNDQLAVRNTHLRSVNQASRVIVKEMSNNRQALMRGILEQAVDTVTGAVGGRATVGVLLRRFGDALHFESIYPETIRERLVMPPGSRLPLTPPPGVPMGISVRAFHDGPQRVDDVTANPDYMPFCADTRAEVAVPMRDNDGRVVGVLNVESDQTGAFDEEDVAALESLAALAVIALRIVEQGQNLRRASSVALMGAWGAEMAHDANHAVGDLRRQLGILKRLPGLRPEHVARIEQIDQLADALRQPELPGKEDAPRSLRQTPTITPLDPIIKRMRPILEEKSEHIPLAIEAGCPDTAVEMDDAYLRRILRHLVRNAAHALCHMEQPPAEPRITIRTRLEGALVQVQVEDNGPGVAPDLAPYLFSSDEPEQELGGHGLAIVQVLVEAHGGTIRLLPRPTGSGSCFAFTLKPLTALPGRD